jgi:hypothetical protein
MYNRLKTLVNQVCNLGSTKWDDHKMVKVILRSLVFHNPMQVQLIRGDPRYKLMPLFVSAFRSFWPPKAAADCQTLSFLASFYKIRLGKNHSKST